MDSISLIAGEPFQEGRYGPVIVVKGKLKGQIGYYDDDGDTGKTAVVYFDDIRDGYYLIPYSSLRHLKPDFKKQVSKLLHGKVCGSMSPEAFKLSRIALDPE